MPPTVMVVIGTRPEAIKMAPLVRALRASRGLGVVVVGTAQHRELMDQMLEAFGLGLDHDLDLMRPAQSLGQVFEAVARRLTPLLLLERPRLLLVQGDTTTALAAALVANRNDIPVGHVEAGLRSHDPLNPFPEEVNRILIDGVSTLLFAPTQKNRRNLAAEGIPLSRVLVTGNTVVDALRLMLTRRRPALPPRVHLFLRKTSGPLAVLTVHRRETWGRPLARVLQAVRFLINRNKRLRVVYPVHPNPRVRKAALAGLRHPRALLCEPLAYPQFLELLRRADLVLSDSGGVQEEAPSLGLPVAVLREVTDRPESVEAGLATVTGTRIDAIVSAAEELLRRRARARRENIFGDGRACARIARRITAFLRRSGRGKKIA